MICKIILYTLRNLFKKILTKTVFIFKISGTSKLPPPWEEEGTTGDKHSLL